MLAKYNGLTPGAKPFLLESVTECNRTGWKTEGKEEQSLSDYHNERKHDEQ
jgi:hypothetical protein